jgi:hypothetical protein
MLEQKKLLIILISVMLVVVIYCVGTRYQMVATATNDFQYVYMYDRLTGKTWQAIGVQSVYLPVFSLSDEQARTIIKKGK